MRSRDTSNVALAASLPAMLWNHSAGAARPAALDLRLHVDVGEHAVRQRVRQAEGDQEILQGALDRDHLLRARC